MSLPKNIKRVREARGLSQADLARAIKKSRSSVQEYEAGEHEPRLDVLRRIAAVCSVDLAELVA